MNKVEQSPKMLKDPTYSQLLVKYLLANSRELIQPPGVSMKAARIIINAVGSYPQAGGAAYIIAERVMRYFEPNPRSIGRIGIPEIACIIPNATECAKAMNRFHERFDIPTVTPTQAASVVTRFAGFTLDTIRQITLSSAREQGLQIPAEITDDKILNPDDKIKGPWSINRAVSLAVHDYLTAVPDLRQRVAERIHIRAEDIRSSRAKQLENAKEKGKKLKEAREKK